MKAFMQNNKRIVIALLVSVLALAGIGAGTFAYYHSTTVEKDNTFTIGNVETKINEDFKQVEETTVNKNPSVENTGINDCFIRMRVTISPENAAALTGLDTSNWIYNAADGFYYYQKKVIPGGETTPLFTGATIGDTVSGDIEITCYQEAIQAEATIEGITVNDATENGMNLIWDAYDNQKNVFATTTP